MKSTFARLTKFILALALVGVMALTLSQHASAAPASNPYLYVGSKLDNTTFDSVLTLREAIMIMTHGTDTFGGGLGRWLSSAEAGALHGCTFSEYDSNHFYIDSCGTGNPTFTVYFVMSGCPCTIVPSTPLPEIPNNVILDGYTYQPGASVNTSPKGMNAKIMVLLYGGNIASVADGLSLGYGDTVKGMEVYGFPGFGILAYSGLRVVGSIIDGNGKDGIVLNAGGAHIGSSALADRNSIYDNGWHGLDVGTNANANQIVGNLIGVPPDSDKGSGNNYSGIALHSSSNYISGNTIAYNSSDGILVLSGLHNNFYNNSIHDNYQLGIDLGNDGVTPNDNLALDADTGANNLQNYPVLTKANAATDTVIVKLTSKPNTTFQIDLFKSPNCDANGYGEGATHLGSFNAATNASGVVKFTQKLPNFKAGIALTAVASGSEGTSEFSKCAIAQ